MLFTLIAQATQPSPPTNIFDFLDGQLSSIAGVIVATTIIMRVVTTHLGNKPYFKKVPAFVYTTLVSLGLTLLANKVLHSLNGDLKTLIGQTISAALASSGFYTWIEQGGDGLETQHPDYIPPVKVPDNLPDAPVAPIDPKPSKETILFE